MPNRSRTLPLIPLDDAVILPNMALAVALATDEARAAVDDALSSDGPAQVVLDVVAGAAVVANRSQVAVANKMRLI